MTVLTFRAFVVNKTEKEFSAEFKDITLDDLSPGEVVIKVAYSSVNYKDALASLPDSRVIRSYPLVPGIDLSGVVARSEDPRFKVGDRDILFVEHNGTQFIPLVGIMHGRFHVQPDANGANEKIAKDNGATVADVAKLGQDERAAVTGTALSKAEFKAAIRQKMAENAAK